MKRAIAALLLCVTEAFAARAAPADQGFPSPKPVRVVLIGASIGQEWNLPDLPRRVHLANHVFEALQAWQFDKSEVLAEALMRPSRKFHLTRTYLKGFFQPPPQPADVVILKECSSYFPGDMPRYEELFKGWVREVRARNIRVMVATVVPVTRARAAKDRGKQEGIREFNDWVRDYAHREGMVVLDLEFALRTDDRERFLRDEFTSGDGSHLNRKAYDILDAVMVRALCDLGSGASCPVGTALLTE